MPYNGFTIEELLEEFKKDMYQKFVDHDDKWDNNSAIRQTWDFEDVFFIEKLREEVSYHYAKCINNDIAVYQDFIKQLREGKKELRMEKGVE